MTDKKNTIITIISMMTSLLLVTIGLSFAYFTANITGTEDSTTIHASGGMMNIHYNGGEAINAPNIEPSNEPFATKTFTLTGNNTTAEDMRYHILLIVEENTFTDNALQYKLTSSNTDSNGDVAPSIEELTGIPTGNNEIFLGNGMFKSPTEGSKVHTYNLELYFPDTEEDQNENQEKKFKAYINIKENIYEYNQIKGVNHPVLFTGMTPVKWDEENNEEIETIESDPDWYNYAEKRWANAKSKDGSYWVWIPRYAYKITSGYHSSETGTIDVKFLKERTNETVDETPIETQGYEPGIKDTSMHHFLHPAFDFDDGQLGFWMAKFEPSVANENEPCYIEPSIENCDNSNLIVRFVPNAKTWRFISISNAYKIATKLNTNKDVYGWLLGEIDSHMMTNHEWGAVAYLSKSKYGAHEEEVWNNAFTGFVTGCSGPNVDAANVATCVEYNTENGEKASTTHNIYGIYDMSGGAWENVMGNANYLEKTSGFTNHELTSLVDKHISRYYSNPENWLNDIGMTYDEFSYGDAVYETSFGAGRYNGSSWIGKEAGAWYGDRSFLLHLNNPWFNRGGQRAYGTIAGIFHFTSAGGEGYVNNSFRLTLSHN